MGHYACDMHPEWFGDYDEEKSKGLYNKYKVTRIGDEKGKHKDCEYFVLDLEHDKYAISAIKAYIKECKKEYPELAKELKEKIKGRAKR